MSIQHFEESAEGEGIRGEKRPGSGEKGVPSGLVDENRFKIGLTAFLIGNGYSMLQILPSHQSIPAPHEDLQNDIAVDTQTDGDVAGNRSRFAVEASAILALDGAERERPPAPGEDERTQRIARYAAKCPPRLTPFTPPPNYGAVIDGAIYRSAFPAQENIEFLRCLKLKTILTLVTGEYPDELERFVLENGIRHEVVPIPANKEEVRIQRHTMMRALAIVMNRSNHPILIHCNKGKHRTGCVVGSFRKCLGASLEEIFREYHAYADPKARILDEVFMTDFDVRSLFWLVRSQGYSENGIVLTYPCPSLPKRITA